MAESQFKNDAFLWFNVQPWTRFHLAVPNVGNDSKSQNGVIRSLVTAIGKMTQLIMLHTDARLSGAPSINTIRRVHKLCIRARTIMVAKAVAPNKAKMEPTHSIPAPEEFRLFPTPYFSVRNHWLKEWCELALLAQTEAVQHTENAVPLEITEDFAGEIGQYMHRIYRDMSIQLLEIPRSRAEALDFTLTEEDFAKYNPSSIVTSREMLDTVPDLENWPTEDDLQPLTDGVPVSQIPILPRFPGAPTSSTATGASVASGSSPAGSFFAPPQP